MMASKYFFLIPFFPGNQKKLEDYIIKSLGALFSLFLKLIINGGICFRDLRTKALSAENRHFDSEFWSEVGLIDRLCKYIYNLFPSLKLSIWNEGLGTSAYRLIRPGYDDGYPPSRKSWGPGGKLISVTIPIIGFTKYESQAFLLGSHLLDFPSFIPSSQKFCSVERRLTNPTDYSFSYFSTNPGDVIIYHWNTVHSEQILGDSVTRLALEVRFLCNE